MQRPAFWRVPCNKPDPDVRYYVSKIWRLLLRVERVGRGFCHGKDKVR